MKKRFTVILIILIITTGVIACRKHHHQSDINIENLSGTYQIKSMIGEYNGENEGERLSDCEKDDEIELKSDLTAKYRDVKEFCRFSSEISCNWYLSNDSLVLTKTLGGFVDGGKIKSFDGKTLVLFYNLESNYTVTATWVKK